MKEVCPGIFRITERGILGAFKPVVNIYIITGTNGLIYDAGYGNNGCIKKFIKEYREIEKICRLRGEPFNIDRILLSHVHADHFSGLKKLRKKLGLRVIITDEMKTIIENSRSYRNSYRITDGMAKGTLSEYISFFLKRLSQKLEYFAYSLYWGLSYIDDPDMVIDSDTKIDINGEDWEIFRSPGHSHEHITLYCSENGILFSGDNVLKSINVWLGPPKSDIDEYENSLKKMLDLPGLKIILPAHGDPVLNPYKRIKEIIVWRKKRTDDLLWILKNSNNNGLSLKAIVNKLYPSDNRMKKEFAGGWIELTLKKLEGEKKITHYKNLYFFNTDN